jgi:hypothetical protein
MKLSHAATIEAEGVAKVNAGGMELTRQSAIRDAVRQASMQTSGVMIETTEKVTPSGSSTTSSRVRTDINLGKPTIVREWTEGELFHVLVRIDAVQPDTPITREHPSYKKKIVATPFHIYKSRQVTDLDDIANGFPRELVRRLENTGKFLTRISKYVFSVEPSRTAIPDINAVKELSGTNDSQFVVSGEILDAGSESEGGALGFFETKKRRFEVEIFIHDGITGAQIAHHRLFRSATGDVIVGRDKPFGTSAFFSTDFGKAVDAMFDSAVALILTELDALPFTAKISRIQEEKIYIDAGATSYIAPGDTLSVYRLKDELQISGSGTNSRYSAPETPIATVTINQVQPLFSIGELSVSPKSAKVRSGDYVRFESLNR